MMERNDLVVLHEPFCNLRDHGMTEVGGRTVRAVGDLKDTLVRLAQRRFVFLKETTDSSHSSVLDDDDFIARVTHSFLVRRPDEIAASYHALKPDMECEEVGIENLWSIYVKAAELSSSPPPVVDSDDLVADPVTTMTSYCHAVGLPFIGDSLTWAPGHRPEWRLTTRWHESIAQSTHFADRPTAYEATAENTPRLAQFSSHHWKFYERLRARRIN